MRQEVCQPRLGRDLERSGAVVLRKEQRRRLMPSVTSANGRPVVMHRPNARSGGKISHIDVVKFVAESPDGPQHRALRDLLGGLTSIGILQLLCRRPDAAPMPPATHPSLRPGQSSKLPQ